MNFQRWNELTNKARDGNLSKGEQLDVMRDYYELQAELQEAQVLIAAATIHCGRPRPDVPGGTHIDLFIPDSARTNAKRSATPVTIERDMQRGGTVLRFVGEGK